MCSEPKGPEPQTCVGCVPLLCDRCLLGLVSETHGGGLGPTPWLWPVGLAGPTTVLGCGPRYGAPGWSRAPCAPKPHLSQAPRQFPGLSLCACGCPSWAASDGLVCAPSPSAVGSGSTGGACAVCQARSVLCCVPPPAPASPPGHPLLPPPVADSHSHGLPGSCTYRVLEVPGFGMDWRPPGSCMCYRLWDLGCGLAACTGCSYTVTRGAQEHTPGLRWSSWSGRSARDSRAARLMSEQRGLQASRFALRHSSPARSDCQEAVGLVSRASQNQGLEP